MPDCAVSRRPNAVQNGLSVVTYKLERHLPWRHRSICDCRDAQFDCFRLKTNGMSTYFLIAEQTWSGVMEHLRCPQLDRLGRELIEAYRQVGDTDLFCLRPDLDGEDVVGDVHRKMAEHRRSCFLCKQVERSTVRPNHNVAVFH